MKNTQTLKKLILFTMFLVLCSQNSYSKQTTLRNFAILKSGADASPYGIFKRSYLAILLELSFDSSGDLYTLQFGTIKGFKFYVFPLQGIGKDLIPISQTEWLQSLSIEDKQNILQKLKFINSLRQNKFITALRYPNDEKETLTLFLIQCIEDQNDKKSQTKSTLKLDPSLENKLSEKILTEKKFIFSFLLRNIKVFTVKNSKENFYKVIKDKNSSFNHSNLYSSIHYHIDFKGNTLNELTPTKVEIAAHDTTPIIFTHSESSEDANQYLSNLSNVVEKSLKRKFNILNKPNLFKTPRINRYIPISRSGAFVSYYSNFILRKYDNFNREGGKLDQLLNEICKGENMEEKGFILESNEEKQKFLGIFKGIKDAKKIVRGFEFDMNKRYSHETAPLVINRGNSNIRKWGLCFVLIILATIVVGFFTWSKVSKGKLIYCLGLIRKN